MYRWIIVLLIFASCKPAIKNKAANYETLIEGQKINDTDIISSDTAKGERYFVYINHNRQSPVYRGALEFEPDSNEKREYKANYHQVKKRYPHKFKSFDLGDLPRQWVPLYLHKGKYYLYAPSEWGNLDRRTITDSTIIYWPMDGPTPAPIIDVKKINTSTVTFKMNPLYFKRFSGVKIHIIDPKSKMAVWEMPADTSEYRYQLFVPLSNATNFDMIVSYCRDHKTGEFIFDKIDYAALLKGK